MALRGSVSSTVPAEAGAVYAVVTDVDRLPEWNAIVNRVVERSPATGMSVEWVVELSAMGKTWTSRSTVRNCDAAAMRFEYQSRTDDGNPSYGDWSWHVTAVPEGSRVTVRWELYPRTFWRRVLFARIRHRQLKREVHASLVALEGTVTAPTERPR